jgi:hypothetical protein
LNVPDQALGKRLKCPKCGTRFVLSAGAEGSPESTVLLSSTNRPPSSQDSMVTRQSSAEAMPTAPGDLRGTFDLPLLNEVAASSGVGTKTSKAPASQQTNDALALFDDPKPAKRRPNPAEARSQARRCPTCGGVVPVGMSICSKCGLDLESGSRVSLEDDLVPPAPPAPSVPLPIYVIGGISFLASLIFTVAAISLWIRGFSGYEYFVPLCLFAVFASVQFLRRKSMKLLVIAMSLGLAINIVALIAMPIYFANIETKAVQRSGPIDDPDQADLAITSVVDQLDTQSLTLGIILILLYAGVSVYLLSPQVRRHFRHSS